MPLQCYFKTLLCFLLTTKQDLLRQLTAASVSQSQDITLRPQGTSHSDRVYGINMVSNEGDPLGRSRSSSTDSLSHPMSLSSDSDGDVVYTPSASSIDGAVHGGKLHSSAAPAAQGRTHTGSNYRPPTAEDGGESDDGGTANPASFAASPDSNSGQSSNANLPLRHPIQLVRDSHANDCVRRSRPRLEPARARRAMTALSRSPRPYRFSSDQASRPESVRRRAYSADHTPFSASTAACRSGQSTQEGSRRFREGHDDQEAAGPKFEEARYPTDRSRSQDATVTQAPTGTSWIDELGTIRRPLRNTYRRSGSTSDSDLSPRRAAIGTSIQTSASRSRQASDFGNVWTSSPAQSNTSDRYPPSSTRAPRAHFSRISYHDRGSRLASRPLDPYSTGNTSYRGRSSLPYTSRPSARRRSHSPLSDRSLCSSSTGSYCSTSTTSSSGSGCRCRHNRARARYDGRGGRARAIYDGRDDLQDLHESFIDTSDGISEMAGSLGDVVREFGRSFRF